MTLVQKSWSLGLTIIVGFWMMVLMSGYPAPFIDDGFYIGAALNLAQHGIYNNPLCPGLAAIGSGSHFFAYMPLHSYALAGWLRLMGINTFSFHLLYTGLAFVSSVLIYRLFPAVGISWLCGLVISLAVYGLLGGTGLRPEAMALMLFVAGVDAYRAQNTAGFFTKNVFLGLTVITSPNLALLAILVSLVSIIYRKILLHRSGRELRNWTLAMAGAYVFSFIIFLACINGSFFEFLHAMALARNVSSGGVYHRLHLFSLLGVTKWIVVQVTFLVLLVALLVKWKGDGQRQEGRYFLGVLFVCYVMLAFSSINSATGCHLWAFGCLIASLLIIVRERFRMNVVAGWLVVFALAAFGHGHIVVEDLLADRPPSRAACEALRNRVEELHPAQINVDVYAMREVYHYQLPANASGFEWATMRGWTTADSLAPNSVSVVSVRNSFATVRSPEAGAACRPLIFLGHTIRGAYANPYALELMDNRFR